MSFCKLDACVALGSSAERSAGREILACVFEGPSALAEVVAFVPEVVPLASMRGGCARAYQPPGGDTQMDWAAAKGSQEMTCVFQAFSCAEVKLLLNEARIELLVVLLSEIGSRVQSTSAVLFALYVLESRRLPPRSLSIVPRTRL